jgi:hypothetical protein
MGTTAQPGTTARLTVDAAGSLLISYIPPKTGASLQGIEAYSDNQQNGQTCGAGGETSSTQGSADSGSSGDSGDGSSDVDGPTPTVTDSDGSFPSATATGGASETSGSSSYSPFDDLFGDDSSSAGLAVPGCLLGLVAGAMVLLV